MMFLRDYLRILLPLLIAFGFYHLTVVPRLEPQKPVATARKPDTKWVTTENPDREDWWDEFFLPNAWQRTTCRLVKTETAILLFKESVQKTDRRWHIKPLTIVIPQRDSGNGKRAIFIENPEGAEIQFKSKVDWTMELPPLENGKLIGDILIYSPPEDPAKDNGLRIEATDLRIDKREISTNKSIKMQFGNSQIEGHELAIHLDKDLLTPEQPGAKADSPFNGIDSLELFYVDRVQMGLNAGGLWPNKDLRDAALRPAYATLKCGGSFVFDFHQSQATLKNGVHMEHIVQGLPIDTFDCHELKMKVGWEEKPKANGPAVVTNDPKQQSGNSNWKLEQVDAVGTTGRTSKDHSGWLKLKAPGMQTEAEGQHLFMDLVNGEVRLSNHLPGSPPKDPTPVYLRRESLQVTAQEVTYLNAQAIANSSETSKLISTTDASKRLGAMSAVGAGRAQFDNKGESWTLFWGKRLFIRPDGDKDLVLIEGSANISNPNQGRFISEQLHLWLTPMTKELSIELAHHFPDGNVPFAIPDRMKADGDVEVDSPQLKAKVDSMQVWFSYPKRPPEDRLPKSSTAPLSAVSGTNGVQVSTNPAPPNLTLGPSSGPAPPPLTQPTFANSPLTAGNRNTVATGAQLDVKAKFMQARVTSHGKTNRIDDLNLEGDFRLSKEQVSDTSPWPFVVKGDKMRLSQTSADTSDIIITGQPARVAVGSGWVIAPELQLKQAENQFWIDHPGELVLPVEALQKPSTSATTGQGSFVSLPSGPAGYRSSPNTSFSTMKTAGDVIQWKEAPRLQWGQRMTFNGHTARFGGGVSIDCRMETDPTTLWHVNARADQMSVEMDQLVSIRNNTRATGQTPQIALIRLEDHVDIKAVQTDQRLRRRSTEHMLLPQLDINIPSQTWIGYGPGELWSRRLGGSSPMGSPQAGTASDNLQCIHLTFRGRMEGVVAQRKSTFYDRIVALLGPIVDWDDALDVHKVDSIRSLTRNQSFLVSDQLNIFDASELSWNQSPNRNNNSGSNAAWEIDATSKVQLDSNTDQGLVTLTADRLGYGARNDVVRIDQSPTQAATIFRTPHGSNTPDVDLKVKSAQMFLKSGKIDMEITELSGSMQPNSRQPVGQPGYGPPPVQPPLNPNGTNQIPNPRDIPLWKRAK